jgi:hypothetical protein
LQPRLQFEHVVKQLESTWATALAQQQASLQTALRHAISVGEFQRFLSQIEEVAREVGEAQLNITPEGQIESSGGNLPLAKAAEGIGQFFDIGTFTNREDELTQKVDAVLRELRKQKSPLRLIILTILLPLLINVLSDLMNPAIRKMIESKEEPLHGSNRTVQISDVKPQTDVRVKMVSAGVLNVREGPNSKSRLLGKLYHGQTVAVLQADRGWELVESQHSSIAIRGWVFSRYLEKANK